MVRKEIQMTPTLEDLEVELANRLRDVTADPNKPFVVDEIVNRLIPTTPSILGLVYASATTVLDKMDDDGGSVTAIIQYHLKQHLMDLGMKLHKSRTQYRNDNNDSVVPFQPKEDS